jgi:serine protease Do
MASCKFLLLLTLLLPTVVAAQTGTARPAEGAHQSDPLHLFNDSIQGLTEHVSGSVVQILTSGYSLSESSKTNTSAVLSPEHGTGAGVILTPDGYLMTNAHVVLNARKIRVMLNDRERARNIEAGKGMRGPLEGKLIGLDRLTDLALIKVEANDLPALTLADSVDLRQGQIVLAFGSPMGLDNSVSMGVVSATARQLDPANPMIYIQTDAPINPGSSGGPLVDVDGKVVGLNTLILSQSGGSEGIGFAIPSNIVRNVYQQLRKDGHVHRGQVGVFVRTITPALAKGLGLPRDEGVILEDVIPGGPADAAGLKVGDIVLAVGERPVHNLREFALSLFRFKIGEPAQLEILRAGQKNTAQVRVIERKDDPQRFADMVTEQQNLVAKLGVMGLTVSGEIRQLLPDLRVESGVIVAARTGDSSYWGDDLQQGDVIHAVNGKPVTDVPTLRAAIDAVRTDIPLVVQVERGGTLNYLVMETD